MMNYTWIATAAFGIESVVADELRRLSIPPEKVENGRVIFCGDAEVGARANLWLRSADRVLLQVGSFRATTFEELFQGVKALEWEHFLPKDACFPVSGKSVRSGLFSVSDCQAITKKAIVERLKAVYKLSWFPETGAKYPIEVALLNDIATLTLDASGVGLHKRGYRKLTGPAPIRETTAAALVLLSRWKPDRPLMDPFCGTGTIPIEAGMIGRRIAPGLKREFQMETWPGFCPKGMWDRLREEARDLIRPEAPALIIGTDSDEKALSMARYHAAQAGVGGDVHFQRMPVAEVRSSRKYGCLITNPPYGERMGEKEECARIYAELGSVYRAMDDWSAFIITSEQTFERSFGKKADKERKLYNGKLQCRYYQYFGALPPRPPRPFDAGRPQPSEPQHP